MGTTLIMVGTAQCTESPNHYAVHLKLIQHCTSTLLQSKKKEKKKRTLFLYRHRDLQDMFNEKSKVQISGYDVLPFCEKKEKEPNFIFFVCLYKIPLKDTKETTEVVTYRRKW